MQFERIEDRKRTSFIIRQLRTSISPGSLVLDVGCGNGIISKAIADSGFKVDAIDVSEKTIEAAKLANAHPNIRYRHVAAGELHAQPAKYSAIICSEVLEHLREPALLLKVLHQSLKSDGVMIVTVPNGAGPREMFVTRPVQYLQKKNNLFTYLLKRAKKALGYRGQTVQSSAEDLFHLQFFTTASLRKLASNNGFKIVEMQNTNFIEQVFPYSLLTRKIHFLQKIDCAIADILPASLTSGFMTVWKKN